MNTKLTLRLDDELIRQAKAYARDEGTSISQIVADYFQAIWKDPSKGAPGKKPLGPKSSRLYGSLKGKKLSRSDYRDHLESKYR